MSNAPYEIEVFYDGDCPLCMREMRMLQRRDTSHRIRFTDIAAPAFSAAAYHKTQAEFMSKIWGRLPNGTWVVGVEVFRRLYAAIGFTRLAAASRWFGVRHVLEVGYHVFARNRLRLTGRCTAERCADGQCAIVART